MNVVFYAFAKKENSTARPTGGTTFNCVLKDSSGVLSPQIEISTTGNPRSYNYAYIEDFGRYYYVEEWTYYRGVWTASLKVDVLASWKIDIGASRLYVFRSSAESDGTIVDNLYPIKSRISTSRRAITPIFNTDPDVLAGTYILGIIVRNDVKYIGVSGVMLSKLIGALFADSYFESVSNMATLTPEIKTSINPMQYLTKIHYIPAAFGAGWSNSWARIGYATMESVSSLKIGQGTATFGDGNFSYMEFGGKYVSDMYLEVNVSDITHPQQSARGRYLRSDPYTKWSLFLPPFGLIDLSSDDMVDASKLTLRVTVDVRTGLSRLIIYGTNIYTVTDSVMVSTVGNCAIDHPIAGVFTPGASFLSMAGSMLSGVQGASSGNYAGLFAGAINAITSYAAGTIPRTSKMGSQGSGSELSGTPELVAQFITVVDDDNEARGRPLCAKRTISALGGYITADPDEFTSAGTSSENRQIKEYIRNGFFYE